MANLVGTALVCSAATVDYWDPDGRLAAGAVGPMIDGTYTTGCARTGCHNKQKTITATDDNYQWAASNDTQTSSRGTNDATGINASRETATPDPTVVDRYMDSFDDSTALDLYMGSVVYGVEQGTSSRTTNRDIAEVASLTFLPVVADIADGYLCQDSLRHGDVLATTVDCGGPLLPFIGASLLKKALNNIPGINLTDEADAIPTQTQSAPTPDQRVQYLFDNWHSTTFPNRTQSINYHLARHGNGRTAFEYTRDAQNFFAQNRGLATQVTLRDGIAGLRIQTKVPVPGGGTRNVGGYWTTNGRLVTFWD